MNHVVGIPLSTFQFRSYVQNCSAVSQKFLLFNKNAFVFQPLNTIDFLIGLQKHVIAIRDTKFNHYRKVCEKYIQILFSLNRLLLLFWKLPFHFFIKSYFMISRFFEEGIMSYKCWMWQKHLWQWGLNHQLFMEYPRQKQLKLPDIELGFHEIWHCALTYIDIM